MAKTPLARHIEKYNQKNIPSVISGITLFLNVYFAGTTFLLISFAFLHIKHLRDFCSVHHGNELTSQNFFGELS